MSDETLDLFIDRDTFLVATTYLADGMDVSHAAPELQAKAAEVFPRARQTISKAIQRGARVACGTDAPGHSPWPERQGAHRPGRPGHDPAAGHPSRHHRLRRVDRRRRPGTSGRGPPSRRHRRARWPADRHHRDRVGLLRHEGRPDLPSPRARLVPASWRPRARTSQTRDGRTTDGHVRPGARRGPRRMVLPRRPPDPPVLRTRRPHPHDDRTRGTITSGQPRRRPRPPCPWHHRGVALRGPAWRAPGGPQLRRHGHHRGGRPGPRTSGCAGLSRRGKSGEPPVAGRRGRSRHRNDPARSGGWSGKPNSSYCPPGGRGLLRGDRSRGDDLDGRTPDRPSVEVLRAATRADRGGGAAGDPAVPHRVHLHPGDWDPDLMGRARAEGRLWDIDTGHDLMVTEPQQVAEALLEIAARWPVHPARTHLTAVTRPPRTGRSGWNPPPALRRRTAPTPIRSPRRSGHRADGGGTTPLLDLVQIEQQVLRHQRVGEAGGEAPGEHVLGELVTGGRAPTARRVEHLQHGGHLQPDRPPKAVARSWPPTPSPTGSCWPTGPPGPSRSIAHPVATIAQADQHRLHPSAQAPGANIHHRQRRARAPATPPDTGAST